MGDLSKMRGVFSVLLGLLVSSVLSRLSYDSYSVLRVNVENEAQAELLLQLEEQGGFDFWSEVGLGRPLDVMTAPETKETLTQWLDDHSLQWSVMIEDVGVLIQEQLIPAANAPEPHAKHNMDWSSYHAMEDIYGWLDYLEVTFDFVETEVIGQTHEGQDMRVVTVCKGGCGNKPAMWIDSGIHAREWISPAVGTWMLNELVENDSAHPDLTEKLDWYFLPDHNPDGYRKTRNSNRMWRKTTSHHSGDSCDGTDANRNWDYHWAEGGSSANSCSETYHGPSAFSEVETQNVRDYVTARRTRSSSTRPCTATASLCCTPGVTPLLTVRDMTRSQRWHPRQTTRCTQCTEPGTRRAASPASSTQPPAPPWTGPLGLLASLMSTALSSETLGTMDSFSHQSKSSPTLRRSGPSTRLQLK